MLVTYQRSQARVCGGQRERVRRTETEEGVGGVDDMAGAEDKKEEEVRCAIFHVCVVDRTIPLSWVRGVPMITGLCMNERGGMRAGG